VVQDKVMTPTEPPPGPLEGLPLSPGGQVVSVAVEEYEQAVVLDVAGEVDLLTASRLHDALTQALDRHPAALVVDLTKVEFLASAGLNVLISAHQQAGERTHFRVVATGSATYRPLQLTGLDHTISVYYSRDDALAAD
jgi:anti-sigma B factor antagonist